MQARGEFMTREQVARAWFTEEYEPVTAMMREAGLCGRGTETEAYARVVSLRYLLLRTHAWNDEVIERCAPSSTTRRATRTPSSTGCARTSRPEPDQGLPRL